LEVQVTGLSQLTRLRMRLEMAASVIDRIGLRVINGQQAGPWPWLIAARIAVVASDVDEEAGVAAVWLLQRRLGAAQHVCLLERDRGQWRVVDGSAASDGSLAPRPSAADSGPGCLLAAEGNSWGRADRAVLTSPAWRCVAGEKFLAAAEVDHLRIGRRVIQVPDHGHVVVAWKGPASSVAFDRVRRERPVIVAEAADGTRLTKIGPGDFVDSATLASA
jgi:hypothetical protein